MKKTFSLLGLLALVSNPACANKREHSHAGSGLPPPAIDSSPLLQVLKKRSTSREYAETPLDRQTVSDILWAAFGRNRPDGKRTAPSAHDGRYIDIYLSDKTGLYKYEAEAHTLVKLGSADMRSATGVQSYVRVAPVALVYVSDETKYLQDEPERRRHLYAAATTGAIVQNVYLYCAEKGLNTGVRADLDTEALHKLMGLSEHQRIILAQSVGHATTLAGIKKSLKSLTSR